MATKRTIKRPAVMVDIQQVMRDYLQNRSMRERSEREEGVIKKLLMGHLETHSDTLDLDDPLPFVSYAKGAPTTKTISGAKRTARRSKVLDEDTVMAFLKKKGLIDQCTQTIRVVDEDAILAANFEGQITDKELATLYEEKITYAFNLVEGTGE